MTPAVRLQDASLKAEITMGKDSVSLDSQELGRRYVATAKESSS